MRITVAVVTLALAAAACGSDPAPAPLPTAPPTTSAPVTTPPPTTPPPSPTPAAPTLPTSARADTPAGAESFARFYMAALDYATRSGDTTTLRSLGQCGACKAFVNQIESLYSGGGRAEGGNITIRDSSTIKHVPGRAALVRVNYDQAAGVEYGATGATGRSPAATNLVFAFTLRRGTADWQVSAVQPVKER